MSLLDQALQRVTKPIVDVDRLPLSEKLLATVIGGAGQLLAPTGFRLYWPLCNRLSPLTRNMQCVLQLSEDCRMRIALDDPYWARLVARSFEYEDDFRHVLRALRDIDYAFFDCGANCGYWSILATSAELGRKPTVAVEAVSTTFEGLQDNCALNDSRFACVHRAVAAEPGHQVQLTGQYHSSASLVASWDHEPTDMGSRVETASLDQLADQHLAKAPSRVVIKLDVEGAEIDAFRGATRLIEERDALFYYEDHGRQADSPTTRYVMDELGLCVLYPAGSGGLIPVDSHADLRAIKTREIEGYNFLACRADSAFLPALDSLR